MVSDSWLDPDSSRLLQPFGQAGARDNTGAQVKQMGEVYYDGYCNERYGYCVDYPDFLIRRAKRTTATASNLSRKTDGRKCGCTEMPKWTLKQVPRSRLSGHTDDLRQKKVTGKELSDNHYFIKGKRTGNHFPTVHPIGRRRFLYHLPRISRRGRHTVQRHRGTGKRIV